MVQQSSMAESSPATSLKWEKIEETPKIYQMYNQTWDSTVGALNLIEGWSYAKDFKTWLATKEKTGAEHWGKA